MSRDQQMMNLRPIITTIDPSKSITPEEIFQNGVLRPIIKLQHDLIVEIFNAYLEKKKLDLLGLTPETRTKKITSIFQQDRELTAEFKGIIVACFTVNEYQTYHAMKTAINKRMVQIIRERVLSIYLQ